MTHRNATHTRAARTLLSAVAGLAIALPAAHAASQNADQHQAKAKTRSSSISISSDNGEVRREISQTINGVEYELTMRNDTIVSVTVDGLALDKDAYERTPDAVIVRDGDQEITFDLDGSGAMRFFGEPGKGVGVQVLPRLQGLNRLDFGNQNAVQWAVTNPPKTMVGISQTSVGEQLREHLGLDEGVGLVVINVVDDLPAAKAGIKEGDVIIEIAGQSVRNSAQLTASLRDREAGDTLGMVILRKGVPQSLELELVAYDGEKLNRGVQFFGWNQGDPVFPEGLRLNERPVLDIDRMRDQLERHVRTAEEQAAHAAQQAQGQNDLLIRRGDRAIVVEREADQLQERAEDLRRLRDDANERIWDLIDELRDADTDGARAELSKQLDSARELATKLHRELEPLRRAAENQFAPRIDGGAEMARHLVEQAQEGLAARNRELEDRLESLEARLDRLLSALENSDKASNRGE